MENKQWFRMPLGEVYRELGSSFEGLSQKTARRRATRGDGLLTRRREGIPGLVGKAFSDFSPVLLVLIALLAILMEQGAGTAPILIITGLYLAAVILLNIRSQAVIESMCGQRIPRVQVLRDGRVFYLPASAVVPGDVLLISEGDIVPADCRIISSTDLFAHEGGVTGNAFSVPKFAVPEHPEQASSPERMSNMLFALSKITHGTARVIVTDTGDGTYVVRTRGREKLPMSGKLRLFGTLERYAHLAGLVVPAVAFVLMLADVVLPPNGGSVYPIFLWGFSLCAASVSFLYPLLGRTAAAAALECAAGKGRGGAVITDLESLERMGAVDTVVFSAESAVLTEECRVVSLYYDNTEHEPSLSGEGGRELLARAAAMLNAADNRLSLSGEGGGTAVYRALLNCAIEQGADSSAYPVVELLRAGGESRFDTALFCREGVFSVCLMGDAAALLPLCADCRFGGDPVRMTPAISARAQQIIAAAQDRGRTVLALAGKKTGYNNLRRVGALQSELTLYGFLIAEQAVSEGFAPALAALCDAGILPVMLTAEQGNAATARKLALSLGVAERDSQILTGEELAAMSDRALTARVGELRAVVAVGGDERFRLVTALARAGRRPAYIGAATCDVAAATAATVSFACALAGGRRRMEVLRRDTDRYGSQVLKMISGVTVRRAEERTGGLAAAVSALRVADSFYRRVRCGAAYLMASQCLRLVTAVICVCTRLPILSAVQLLVGGLLIDTFATLAFSRRGEEPRLSASGRSAPPPPPAVQLRGILPFMLVAGSLSVLIPYLTYSLGAFSIDSLCAAVFTASLLCQLALYANASCRGSVLSPAEWRGGVCSGMFYVSVLLFLLLSVLLPQVGAPFGLSPASAHDLLYAFLTPLLLLPALELRKYFRAARSRES